MSNQELISLTVSELGFLWSGFAINEMSKWYLTAFRAQTKDEDIKSLFSFVLQENVEIVKKRKTLLEEEGYPLPVGFSEKDIIENTASLFSDRFLLYYLHVGARLGLEFHSRSLALATTRDIRAYHTECVKSGITIYEKVIDLLLKKGVYWKPPSLPAPPTSEVIQKSSYLNGWFGDTRPLNSMEIANLYLIIDVLYIIEALAKGFGQTTQSMTVSEFMQKGATIVKRQYIALGELLVKSELPVPPSYSAEITGSKSRIFSDRIMVTHLAGLFGTLVSQYGFSLGTVMNHELLASYTKQIMRAGAFSERLTRLLIDREWLEKVPGA